MSSNSKQFSIFGHKYVVYFDAFEFCGVYYGKHSCDESYILDCLNAEMSEYNPPNIIHLIDNNSTDITHLYIDQKSTTYLDIWTASLEMVEPHLTTEDNLSTADKWVGILKENLLEIYDV